MAGKPSNNGSAIERRRHELGISQGQLAKMIGVRTNLITKWEHGMHIPRRETLEELGKALNCDWRSLMD